MKPKYRKWILRGVIHERVRDLFIGNSEHHGFEIEELEVDKDHIHIFLSFAPSLRYRRLGGLLKAVSGKETRQLFPEVKKQLWEGKFLENGYFVRTVGDKAITEVIKKGAGIDYA